MARSPKSSGSPLHPLVEQFVQSTESLRNLAERMPEPREPVVQAIIDLTHVRSGRQVRDEVRARLRQLDLTKCDPDLHILLLDAWANAAVASDSHGSQEARDEARALTRRARDLVSERTPPEIEALVLQLESFTFNVEGNLARRMEILEKARRIVPSSSPRYVLGLLSYLWHCAMEGRLAEHSEELAELRGRPELHSRLQLIELVNAVDTGRLDEAVRLSAEMGHPWSPEWQAGPLARHSSTFRWLQAAIAMLKGDYSLEGAYRALGFADPSCPDYAGPELHSDKLPVWVWVWHHLLDRRPEEALDRAKVEAAEWGQAYYTALGPMPLNLGRCELACGHAEAARQCLEKRRRMGNVRYLDDLFLARVELLAGDRRAAAAHFAAALAAADRYGARGRVDFELRMACELSPGDIAWLARAAGELPAAQVVSGGGPAGRAPATARQQPLVGASPVLARVREAIATLAPLDVPVLVTGETGTGKELVARLLHERGPRRERPFVAINCGAIAETLLESELFGHEKGAFTGAERPRKGIFEEAADGTVLLDEIGEISPRLQVMLLRVLETGEIRPVGSSRSRQVKCRILAATNVDLHQAVEDKLFRGDLYYRLKRMEIGLPPLRERRDDIVPLAEHFLREGRSDGRRPLLSPRLAAWLGERSWPGNARELRNFIERLRLLNSEKLEYDLSDIPPETDAAGARRIPEAPAVPGPDSPGAVPGPAAVGSPHPENKPRDEKDETAFLSRGHHPLRRQERLRGLFARHGRLTRQELAALLGISPDTASRDLRILIAEGLVEKVEPTASPRTHYFRLKSGAESGG
jgi:DNA-binding NtrC family response regulator